MGDNMNKENNKSWGFLLLMILLVIAMIITVITKPITEEQNKFKDNVENNKNVKESENIQENKELTYIENEIVIITKENTDEVELKNITKEYEAELWKELDYPNKYMLTFDKSMKYEELNNIINEIKMNTIIEDAHLCYITQSIEGQKF